MPINVKEGIDSDTAEKFVINRYTGSHVDGIYVRDEPPTVINALGSVQQPTAKDLQSLPEGEKSTDIKRVISLKRLFTSNDLAGTLADIIIYKGTEYRVVSDGDWDSYGYTDALVARVRSNA